MKMYHDYIDNMTAQMANTERSNCVQVDKKDII